MRKGVAETSAVSPALTRPRPSEATRHHPSWRPPSGELEWGAQSVQLGKTEKPETEKRILEEVGSYGRQIGWMMEALEVVIEAIASNPNGPLSRDRMDEAEIERLTRFAELLKAVEAIKKA